MIIFIWLNLYFLLPNLFNFNQLVKKNYNNKPQTLFFEGKNPKHKLKTQSILESTNLYLTTHFLHLPPLFSFEFWFVLPLQRTMNPMKESEAEAAATVNDPMMEEEVEAGTVFDISLEQSPSTSLHKITVHESMRSNFRYTYFFPHCFLSMLIIMLPHFQCFFFLFLSVLLLGVQN